jgi:CheY-like chemotaxis protein
MARKKSKAQSESSKSPRLRVLALDDSLTIRKLIELVTRTMDGELELAADGAEGIQAATKRPPDLLLLDYMLPDMRGTDVCEALQKAKRTARIPVVVMSGKGEDVVARFEDYRQVVGYLHKPFPPDALRSFVASAQAGELAPGSVKATPPALPHRPAPTPRSVIEALGQTKLRPASRERTGEAAQILFRILRDGFERIPEWSAERAGRPPGPYFATKLLTPSRVQALCAALAPVLVEPIQSDSSTPNSGPSQR